MNQKDFDLIKQFTRIEWLLHRYHLQNHTQHGPMGDPRRGQGRVLAILKMKPEISQKDLSYLLDMRPQSLGELLSKLEKSGYITRTPSETDRRVMNIKLTKEGGEATEQEFSFDKLFECLSQEEQKDLSSYLSRIIETLEAQMGEVQPEPDFGHHNFGGNPFDHHFRGHPNQVGRRWGRGKDFDYYAGIEEEYPGDGQFDPSLAMRRPEMMHFGHRSGMGRGSEERPGQSKDRQDEE